MVFQLKKVLSEEEAKRAASPEKVEDGDHPATFDLIWTGKSAKLRHACEAVGALAKYENGSIGAEDFPGHAVRVKVGIEKKKGFPDRNVIEDYAAATAARVVNLREAG